MNLDIMLLSIVPNKNRNIEQCMGYVNGKTNPVSIIGQIRVVPVE